MAGVSNYSKQIRKEDFTEAAEMASKSSPKDFKTVSKMFKKEPMTAEQFGIFLGGCKYPTKKISDKTIKRYIEKMCAMSGGKLKVSQFMSVVDDVEMYLIQPEFHELLIAFFDTDFFGAKGKPKTCVNANQQLRAQLANNVEIYLSDDIKTQIKYTPQFLNARLEDILSEKINNEFRGMLATIQSADDAIQYQLMLETVDRLVAIRRWMNEWDARVKLIKQEFANTDEEKKDAINNTGVFKHKELQDILIDVIASIFEGKCYEYISEEEEIFYPALYAAMKMYDITAMPGHELTLWLEEMERNISNYSRYQKIRRKARMLFNEDDLLEGKILESIDKIARTQLVSNETDMSPKQYEILVRMQGDASVKEKQEILCKLEQTGDLSLDEKTLKEIMDLKDGIEKKRKFGMIK